LKVWDLLLLNTRIPNPELTNPKSTMHTPKILIVDDEPDILEFLKYNLVREKYTVITASNGKEAIKIATKERPDLIVLDIMMPELDGVEVCRHLRARPEFANTVIAFLTARDEDYAQIAALDVGGDDYITKPIRPRVFISRIKALLRRFDGTDTKENESILQISDLTINKEKITVSRNGEEIELPKKEFELLCLLVSRPGKVFSREEIFHKIWGNDVIVGERTIDVHIRKLREKLQHDYIKTLKGIGYKFDF
jgi:two-component system, OmpR family, alkaline phosphatase synthesis response regulator PhoP